MATGQCILKLKCNQGSLFIQTEKMKIRPIVVLLIAIRQYIYGTKKQSHGNVT
jgi:hypothetical protein